MAYAGAGIGTGIDVPKKTKITPPPQYIGGYGTATTARVRQPDEVIPPKIVGGYSAVARPTTGTQTTGNTQSTTEVDRKRKTQTIYTNPLGVSRYANTARKMLLGT